MSKTKEVVALTTFVVEKGKSVAPGTSVKLDAADAESLVARGLARWPDAPAAAAQEPDPDNGEGKKADGEGGAPDPLGLGDGKAGRKDAGKPGA